MMKKNFLNRMNAKIAMAIVALTSTFFVGCSEENIDVAGSTPGTTELPNPVCTINVSVLDLTNGTNITNLPLTVSPAGIATVNGSTITITGETIAQQEIEITATNDGTYTEDGKTKVGIPALKAGQVASLSATILMVKKSQGGVEEGEFELKSIDITTTQSTTISNSKDAVTNNTDKALANQTLKFENAAKNGSEVGTFEGTGEVAQTVYNGMKANSSVKTTDVTFEGITVPAYTKAVVTASVTTTVKTYTVIESNGVDTKTSKFNVTEYATSAYYTLVYIGEGEQPELGEAVYTITLNVYDMETGQELSELADQMTSKYAIQNGVITIKGESIAAEDLKISFAGNSVYNAYETIVKVPELSKGSNGKTTVNIPLIKKSSGGSSEEQEYTVISTTIEAPITVVGGAGWSVYETKTPSLENETNYDVVDTYIPFTGLKGFQVVESEAGRATVGTLSELEQEVINNLKNDANYAKEKDYKYGPVTICPWGQFSFKLTIWKYNTKCLVKVSNNSTGEETTIAIDLVNYGMTATDATLTAIPGHEGHWGHNGHGAHDHGHGNGNAGGSIVTPEN